MQKTIEQLVAEAEGYIKTHEADYTQLSTIDIYSCKEALKNSYDNGNIRNLKLKGLIKDLIAQLETLYANVSIIKEASRKDRIPTNRAFAQRMKSYRS